MLIEQQIAERRERARGAAIEALQFARANGLL